MADLTPLARVSRVAGLGMVTLRLDLEAAGRPLAQALGVALPGRTAITHEGSRSLGWMSPDELLLVLPHDEVPAALAAAQAALAGGHHLVHDVSDMRCAFDLIGEGAGDALAKLSPTDFDRLPGDGLRRTRLSQVPAAFWRVPGGFRVIAFRSVEAYLRGLLETAAAPGTWLAAR